MWSYLVAPFAWLMHQLYELLFNNYALALVAYAIIVKVLLFPFSIKQQKNSLNMARLKPYQDALQKKYGNDRERYNIELQKLYQQEGYNPMSSCTPMLIQLPLIFMIYNVVRHPLSFIGINGKWALRASEMKGAVLELAEKVKDFLPSNMVKDGKIIEKVANKISDYELQIYQAANKADIDLDIGGGKLFGFIDLSSTPAEKFWSWALLIPIICCATSFLVSWISQKFSPMQQDPAAQGSNKMMLYMMPIMSLFFTYNLNCALGVYWIIGNILSVGQTFLLNKMYDPKKVLEESNKKIVKEKAEKKNTDRSIAAQKKIKAMEATGTKKKKG